MKAIILGATGLVGSKLLDLLLADERFEKVLIFVRRGTGKKSAKLEEHVIDFDQPESWKHLVKGDVLFSAFGTTIKQAGSKEAQYKIDYTYQYQFAEAAADNGVKTYVLISAAFSNPKSSVFYSRIKGELEQAVMRLPFNNIHILRPGMLEGYRSQHRPGEKFFSGVMKAIGLIPGLKSMKPIRDLQVAKAMVNAASKDGHGIHVYPPKSLFELAGA
ncbi:MAG: NAD(P)H-binding protein [Bacteroidetes bacterium]|nr:NAD(P)H-binding protein [Bacteroidota bacterium]